jgi:putative transposase
LETTIYRTYRFRLRATAKQAACLRRHAGCCRYIWNQALRKQLNRLDRGERFAGFTEMCHWLTEWRSNLEMAFLSEPPVHAQQMTLKRLERAFQRFFKKAGGIPRFKRQRDPISITEPDRKAIKVDEANQRVWVPKVGFIRYRRSCFIAGKILNTSVRHDAFGWEIIIQSERQLAPTGPKTTEIGAGDLGITHFLTFDNGEMERSLKAHHKDLPRLRRYQRACARKVEAQKRALGITGNIPKGTHLPVSKRLDKAYQRLARMHAKIARRRADFLHKLSAKIASNYAVFVLENLRVKNLCRSAHGTLENPGKLVRLKSNQNRSILDQGWSMFRQQIGYKLPEHGGQLLLVPAHYTSQRCHVCDYTDAANRCHERFCCLACGHEEDADINAAKNILAAGLAVLAGNGHALVEDAVKSCRPEKREPAEERAKRNPDSPQFGIPIH